MCCSVLQRVAVCCSALQCDDEYCHRHRAARNVAVCCSVLQRVAVCCSVVVSTVIAIELSKPVLQCAAVRCSVLQCVAVCCSVSQCVAVCYSVSQCVASDDEHLSLLYSCPHLQCVAVCDRALQCDEYIMYPNTRLLGKISSLLTVCVCVCVLVGDNPEIHHNLLYVLDTSPDTSSTLPPIKKMRLCLFLSFCHERSMAMANTTIHTHALTHTHIHNAKA